MANNDNRTEEQKEYFEKRAGTDEARYHVVPHEEKGWAIKIEGEDGHQHKTDSKQDAIKEAKRLAEEAGTIAYVHGEDGKIEEQHNYKDETE